MYLPCIRIASIIISILILIATLSSAQQPIVSEDKPVYICQPCGCDCDDKSYDQPGDCPCCNMTMVIKGVQMKVAVLIFDGVELLDFSGPLEVFSVDGAHFEAFTVAPTDQPIKTGMGATTIVPTHSIDSAPEVGMLVVPGGAVDNIMQNEKVLDYIRATSKTAEIVLSVCSGNFVMVKAGLLDGLKTTAHSGDIDALEKFAPNSTVVRGVRYVDNGKFICAGGVSSGIDASLYIIEKLHGNERADEIAVYLEHNRRVK